MKFGLERIAVEVPRHSLDLALLAEARGVDVKKYHQGIGQEFMAVPSPDEDVVTLGAAAAERALEGVDRNRIRTVIFATESGVDQSKAAAIYVHKLLGLPRNCRTVEMKQACCSGTSALHFALASVALEPESKILVICADIARYGLGTAGEPTQGAGAVAMVVSSQPKIATINPKVGYFTDDVMDFWRPNYREEALVDGKYSIKVYMHALEQACKAYHIETGEGFDSFQHFCYHLPFTRMGLKAHLHLAKVVESSLTGSELHAQVQPSLQLNPKTGNAYTASLYMGLLSLLEQQEDLAGRKVGMFSYGSGCMGAFFSLEILAGYKEALPQESSQEILAKREALDMATYETWYETRMPQDGSAFDTPHISDRPFRFAGVADHKRRYERLDGRLEHSSSSASEHFVAAPLPDS